MAQSTSADTADRFAQFLETYYRDEIATLAQRYPNDQKSLTITYSDLYQFDPDIAYDFLKHPARIRQSLEDALRVVELPIEATLPNAHVRVSGLSDEFTFYPDEFSPTNHHGQFRAIHGEISKATDVYARMERASFECQRCGTQTEIPQTDGDFQEPHECQGCERQGPFQINYAQSQFVDGQKLRIKTPPEYAHGDGKDIDGFVEDDLTGRANVGDRVTVSAAVDLEQETSGRDKQNKFAPYLDIHHIEVEETDAEDVEISAEQKERITELAGGVDGDPLELAAESLAPKIYGYQTPKKAIILALVGGSRTEYASGGFDRGEFHVLLIGDPSTAKSKLVNRAEQVGWRTVGVSGKGATEAGVTAAATQDDFGGGDWTLSSGAFVKANKGVVCADELDDMPSEVRAAMLEPMSKQYINVNKGGINTTLETRTGVIAAANPVHGRFDPYEPIADQFVFGGTLLSRFDLVYTFKDKPDETEDEEVAEHILTARDAAKREEEGLETEDVPSVSPPVERDLLRKWIALAKRQPKPVFANEEVHDEIKEAFCSLRGMHGYDPDEPIPVTFRSLEGLVRVAEAAAKFEFSDEITMRHVEIATSLVGESMQDVGKDADGNYDADVIETGQSQSQKQRRKTIVETLKEMQQERDTGRVAVDDLLDNLTADEKTIQNDIDNLKQQGRIYEPQAGELRFIGW